MAGWDIEPAGVRGVVKKTKHQAEDFDQQLKNISTALKGASGNADSSIIMAALVGLATHKQPDVKFVFSRTGATLEAAVEATNAYLAGDLEMARNAQQSAASVQPPHQPEPVSGLGMPDPRQRMPGAGGPR